ncbi:MAG: hypothetical protein WCK78_12755 [Paludibacter sp.]
MNKDEFNSLVEIKVQDLVSLIIEQNQYDFLDAVKYLYDSKLYDSMLNEKTKLWHLSNYKLFEMLLEEKQTHELKYPDYV